MHTMQNNRNSVLVLYWFVHKMPRTHWSLFELTQYSRNNYFGCWNYEIKDTYFGEIVFTVVLIHFPVSSWNVINRDLKIYQCHPKEQIQVRLSFVCSVDLWYRCLTTLSTCNPWWRIPEYPMISTDMPKVIEKVSHNNCMEVILSWVGTEIQSRNNDVIDFEMYDSHKSAVPLI